MRPLKTPPERTVPVERLLVAALMWPLGPESKRWVVPI